MESTPSNGSESPTPLTRRTDPAPAERPWLRSRRAHTFGLGALCGALGLSLIVVVTSIFAASGARGPVLPAPAPASEVRITPTPTPTPSPTPEAPATIVPVAPETTEPAVEDGDTADPVVDQAPAPVPVESEPAPEDAATDGPGNSGSAPGRTKEPKSP